MRWTKVPPPCPWLHAIFTKSTNHARTATNIGHGKAIAAMNSGARLAGIALATFLLWMTPARGEDYIGACDASAAVALGPDHFVVANDEDNILRIYRLGVAAAVAHVALDDFAEPDPRRPEMDIEAAAAIGPRIYWITSHGASAKGKHRASRHRLFATDIRTDGPVPTLTPVGRAYGHLLDDMAKAAALAPYKLDEAAQIAPKEPGGLNMEGLAATPQGTLLIGFRNPLPHGKALMVELTNPAAVITGTRAQIGRVTELDLGGLGIRAMDSGPDGYRIVAGPPGGGRPFRLYAWRGGDDKPRAMAGVNFGKLHPEALFATPAGQRFALSDDGTRDMDGRECKNLPAAEQRFRMIEIAP